MTFDLEAILRSKAAMKNRLAHLPIGEKLRMLDELRQRTITIRGAKLLPLQGQDEPSNH